MNTEESLLNQILTEALEGPQLGCLDRATFPAQMEVLIEPGDTIERKLARLVRAVNDKQRALSSFKPNHPILRFDDENPKSLIELLDVYWDWTLGDRLRMPKELVAAVVLKNYYEALCRFVPTPSATEMNMKLESFMFQGRMQEYD